MFVGRGETRLAQRTGSIADWPSVSCLIVKTLPVWYFTAVLQALSLLSGPQRHLWHFEKFGLITRRRPLR